MLNDLLATENGLAARGISAEARHPDIKDMAKGPALRVRLLSSGRVAQLDLIEDAGRGVVWVARDGQHNGFPGLKTTAGLLRMDKAERAAHDASWKAVKDPGLQRAELIRLVDTHPLDSGLRASWPNKGHRTRIAERGQALHVLSSNPSTAAVPAAFHRFLAALAGTPSFLEDLLAHLTDKLKTGGSEWLEQIRAALLGPVALVIDVAAREFPRSASDPRQVGPVSAALSAAATGGRPMVGVCALSGTAGPLHTGNFPQPNLPGLGQTYVYSRNPDIPSLVRYGRTAAESFQVNPAVLGRAAAALQYLTADERKGQTWRLIPGEAGDKQDLLVVSMLDPGTNLAAALADDEVGGEAALEELASRVIDHTHGKLLSDEVDDDVAIMVLRTVDPANRKTIYHRQVKPLQARDAARRWTEARQNVPGWLGFPMPQKKGQPVVLRRPPRLPPLSLIRVSRAQFVAGGQRRVDVVGVTAATAFGLFLHEGDVTRHARGTLGILVQRYGILLAGLAAERRQSIDALKAFDPKADLRDHALQALTWFGALLHHLGHHARRDPNMPDDTLYTEDFAFRLGQYLSVVDLIHIGYCNDVRGGDVPPGLLGNGVLAIAGEHPGKALGILQVRMKPYCAWATDADAAYAKAEKLTAENGDEKDNKRRARAIRRGISQYRRSRELARFLYALKKFYDVSDKKPDDEFRAELLLGYVAGLSPLPKRRDNLLRLGKALCEQHIVGTSP